MGRRARALSSHGKQQRGSLAILRLDAREPASGASRSFVLHLIDFLRKVERTGGPEIDLAADLYRVVAAADAFAVGTPPTPTVGQLADDLESRAAQVADNAEQPLVWHDLEHVVGLLRRIAALDLAPRATFA